MTRTSRHKSQQNLVFGTRIVLDELNYLRTTHSAEQLHVPWPWPWLSEHQPESYDQLVKKLELAGEELTHSSRSTFGSLLEVLWWCEEHDISLDEIRFKDNLSKYREAGSRPNQIIREGDEVREELLAAIAIIQSHRTRDETRGWARTPRDSEKRQ